MGDVTEIKVPPRSRKHRFLEVEELHGVLNVAVNREFLLRVIDDSLMKEAFQFVNEKAFSLFESGVLREPYVVSVAVEGSRLFATVHPKVEGVSRG